VIGSANMDLTVAVPRLPREGETVSGGTFYMSHGGKGANQAVAAARLGADVRFVGCVGRDEHGDRIAEQFVREGIPAEGLNRVEGAPTGVAVIVVDADGRNQIAVAPGANLKLVPEVLQRHAAWLGWAEVLLCQLETPLETVERALAGARRRGVLTVLNPAPARPLSDSLLSLVDCLTPNESEAGLLSGIDVEGRDSAAEAGRRLIGRGVERVVVTLGARGAVLCAEGRTLQIPAFPVKAVDTTGAGDAFNGALAVGLAEGRAWDEAMRFAGAAAALACTKPGAQSSLPARSEVDALLALGQDPSPPGSAERVRE
jgi:ribokinase